MKLLRGIEHINMVNTEALDCEDPDVVLKEGGIDKAFAVIEITTQRGCPMESAIHFFTES